MQLTESQEMLLKRIIERLNADSNHSYKTGELDFVPEKWNEKTALDMILVKYCMNNFPELVEPKE